MKPNPLAADLDHVLLHTQCLWEELRGERIFITGGTGFFGRWMLESFVRANDALDLNASACVLTHKTPHLAHRAIQLHAGDFTSFEFPRATFHSVLHLANDPDLDANLRGTRRVLDFARATGAKRFLFTSSGAAYGSQPSELTHIPEEYAGEPNTAYGRSKRACEFMCATDARQYGFAAPIARCFAFAGPHLPLDLNFAIGNFIRDALAGSPIRIAGDGTPFRSYLYAADLAVWLWTILLRGESRRLYNVGSGVDLSIADLAGKVAAIVAPSAWIAIARQSVPGTPVERYVPSVERAKTELGLEVRIPLDEAIKRTADWYFERKLC